MVAFFYFPASVAKVWLIAGMGINICDFQEVVPSKQ